MNDISSPPELAPLQAGRASPSAPPARRAVVQPVLLSLLVATIGILTANIWLAAHLLKQQSDVTKEHLFWVLCQPGHTLGERATAFRRLAADGNKEWHSAMLSDLELSGITLAGADLRGAGFHRANFRRANLAGANLSQSSMELADLTGADLSEADLSEAQLYRAVLKDTKLRRAKLQAGRLQEVNGENADLMVADLSDADCLMANLTGANLAGANMSGARLEGAILKGSNLSLARLDSANLKDADFTDSNWWHARGLSSAQIELLKKRFLPSDSATPALKGDFRKWIAGGNPKSE
jgi:uncharacterized protein YjbI with pentapeptide repeats